MKLNQKPKWEHFKFQLIYKLLDTDYKAEHLMEEFPGTTSLPQIVINGIHIGGYSDFEEVMEMSKECLDMETTWSRFPK